VNKAEYSALLANYQKARLGEQADNAGSVRFEVAVPPTSPVLPVWPKRGQLLAEVWLAAIAIGAGVAYWWHTLHPVVTSDRAVSALTNFPLLGVVGGAFPFRARIDNRRRILRISAAAACLILALIAVLVLNHVGVRLSFLYGASAVKS
jgi:hypothetical protein